MRAERLMAGGHSAMTARIMTSGEDRELGVTATGSTQATAYLLKAGLTEFTTVAASTGARLPESPPGDEFFVANRGANALLVYPPVGGIINNAAVDAGNSLAAGASAVYKFTTNINSIRLA